MILCVFPFSRMKPLLVSSEVDLVAIGTDDVTSGVSYPERVDQSSEPIEYPTKESVDEEGESTEAAVTDQAFDAASNGLVVIDH